MEHFPFFNAALNMPTMDEKVHGPTILTTTVNAYGLLAHVGVGQRRSSGNLNTQGSQKA